MLFWVYILQSEIDGSFYFGYTSDLQKRLCEHNAGLSEYTSRKMPWKLVYFEEFSSKKEAIIRERQLKRIKNRAVYLKIIQGFSGL